jgi:hypothetical protein
VHEKATTSPDPWRHKLVVEKLVNAFTALETKQKSTMQQLLIQHSVWDYFLLYQLLFDEYSTLFDTWFPTIPSLGTSDKKGVKRKRSGPMSVQFNDNVLVRTIPIEDAKEQEEKAEENKEEEAQDEEQEEDKLNSIQWLLRRFHQIKMDIQYSSEHLEQYQPIMQLLGKSVENYFITLSETVEHLHQQHKQLLMDLEPYALEDKFTQTLHEQMSHVYDENSQKVHEILSDPHQ